MLYWDYPTSYGFDGLSGPEQGGKIPFYQLIGFL